LKARFFTLAALALFAGAAACSTTPSTPSSSSSSSGNNAPAATITIRQSGVDLKGVDVAAGSQVMFVNNDTISHNMTSDPHPEHDDCPPLNQVGFLLPGESRLSGNLNTTRVCGFHDHDDGQNNKWHGLITIH
jgi:plastocyanin